MTEPGAVSVQDLDGTDARRFRHMPGLDGVRAMAVILVVMFHFGYLWDKHNNGGLFPGGFIGVDVFFVLSGFLITSILVGEKSKTGGVSFTKFYGRRGARLLPALFVFLIGYALWTHHGGSSWTSLVKPIAAAFFYVSNLAQTYFLKRMAHGQLVFTWSLAVEEQFYLVWPALLVFGVMRFAKTRRAVVLTVLGGALLSALIRAYTWNWGSGYPAAYMRLDCRADGLLIGAACAFLWRWRMVPTKWLNQAALISLVGLLAVVFLWTLSNDGMFQGGFTLVSLAVGLIVLAVAENTFTLLPFFEWSPMRAIGRVSYGIYLWHSLGLHIAAVELKGDSKPLIGLAGLSLTAVFVLLSWYLVEQPFLRVKDRLFASPVAH